MLGLGLVAGFRVVRNLLRGLSRLLDLYLPDRLWISRLILGLDVFDGCRLTGFVVVIDDVGLGGTILVGLGAAADRLFLLLVFTSGGTFPSVLPFPKSSTHGGVIVSSSAQLVRDEAHRLSPAKMIARRTKVAVE